MIVANQSFDDLLVDFCTKKSLSVLDRAILDHAIDAWPMARLAKNHGTTANALHRRKKELFANFREYLERRGVTGSADVFDS